jgi:hypothetical protein
MKLRETFYDRLAREAVVEVDRAAFACQVLMAYKSPELKRHLGLGYGAQGRGYKEQRKDADKYVIDNAFHLSILWQLYTRGPLGTLRAKRFARAVERANALAMKLRPVAAPADEVEE